MPCYLCVCVNILGVGEWRPWRRYDYVRETGFFRPGPVSNSANHDHSTYVVISLITLILLPIVLIALFSRRYLELLV